jgi:membrane associated rhomboid family serine protease
MIPLRDENPTRTIPWVNYLLIALNLLVWGWQYLAELSGVTWLAAAYGLVPRRILADPLGDAFTIVASMFMHGSFAHLGGNLLFLHIFGDNIEDKLGHRRYIVFYLLGGLFAALSQTLVDPNSSLPMVGASGAIASVLGGYLVLYPRAPITVLNPIFPLWFFLGPFFVFPAWLVVGEWFLWNLIPGVQSLSGESQGGVAFFAHIGGFLGGLVTVKPFCRGRQLPQTARVWDGWRPPPRPRGPQGGSPLSTRRKPPSFYDRDGFH